MHYKVPMTPQQIEAQRTPPSRVAKPGRYTGGELNQVVKDWNEVGYRVAMAFPDIYDIGMSNLGWMIHYATSSTSTATCWPSVFCPWDDMEASMREQDIPSSRWRRST